MSIFNSITFLIIFFSNVIIFSSQILVKSSRVNFSAAQKAFQLNESTSKSTCFYQIYCNLNILKVVLKIIKCSLSQITFYLLQKKNERFETISENFWTAIELIQIWVENSVRLKKIGDLEAWNQHTLCVDDFDQNAQDE